MLHTHYLNCTIFLCQEKSTAFLCRIFRKREGIKLKYALTFKERKNIEQKRRNKEWEVINLFELQNKFLATQLMAGSFSASSEKVWDGKREIANKRRNFIGTNCFSWGWFVSDVLGNFLRIQFVLGRSNCERWNLFTDILIPRKNQTPVEWKVLFLNVWLTCVLFVLKMDTFLLTAFSFTFLPLRYFFLLKTTTATFILTG